jgi:hypothetical protein
MTDLALSSRLIHSPFLDSSDASLMKGDDQNLPSEISPLGIFHPHPNPLHASIPTSGSASSFLGFESNLNSRLVARRHFRAG